MGWLAKVRTERMSEGACPPLRRLLSILLLLFVATVPGRANYCAQPGKSGTATISGTVNTYFPGSGSVAVGATSITLGASSGAATGISTGDMLLVIQMQNTTYATNNSTRYGTGTTGGNGSGYSA